jgi:hypothetical protein
MQPLRAPLVPPHAEPADAVSGLQDAAVGQAAHAPHPGGAEGRPAQTKARIRIAIRGYAIRGIASTRLIFEEIIEDLREPDLRELAERHAVRMLAYPRHLIEIEFLDLPEHERYFRFGNDPAVIVKPQRLTTSFGDDKIKG